MVESQKSRFIPEKTAQNCDFRHVTRGLEGQVTWPILGYNYGPKVLPKKFWEGAGGCSGCTWVFKMGIQTLFQNFLKDPTLEAEMSLNDSFLTQ